LGGKRKKNSIGKKKRGYGGGRDVKRGSNQRDKRWWGSTGTRGVDTVKGIRERRKSRRGRRGNNSDLRKSYRGNRRAAASEKS